MADNLALKLLVAGIIGAVVGAAGYVFGFLPRTLSRSHDSVSIKIR